MSRRRQRTVEKACGYCGGNGKVELGGCSVCDGTGIIIFELGPDEQLRRCNVCGGGGHYGAGRCGECDGTGWNRVRVRHG